MGHKTKAKDELQSALTDMIHAQELMNEALKSVEKEDNRQLIQNTLSSVDKAVDTTRTSAYGFVD